jgi:hypothetical protein
MCRSCSSRAKKRRRLLAELKGQEIDWREYFREELLSGLVEAKDLRATRRAARKRKRKARGRFR